MSKQYETKCKIIDSLETLLQTRTLDKIRINDICRQSGVSRTTFYVYFQDIYGAVQWCWDDLCSRTLYRINKDLTWDEGHLALFSGLKEREVFYQKVFVDKDLNSLFTYGYHKAFTHHIENLETRLGRPLSDQELLELDYAGRAHSAMTSKWAEEGMIPTPEEMTMLCHRCIPPFSL